MKIKEIYFTKRKLTPDEAADHLDYLGEFSNSLEEADGRFPVENSCSPASKRWFLANADNEHDAKLCLDRARRFLRSEIYKEEIICHAGINRDDTEKHIKSPAIFKDNDTDDAAYRFTFSWIQGYLESQGIAAEEIAMWETKAETREV